MVISEKKICAGELSSTYSTNRWQSQVGAASLFLLSSHAKGRLGSWYVWERSKRGEIQQSREGEGDGGEKLLFGFMLWGIIYVETWLRSIALLLPRPHSVSRPLIKLPLSHPKCTLLQ